RVLLASSVVGTVLSVVMIVRAAGVLEGFEGPGAVATALMEHTMNVAGCVLLGSLTGLTISGVPLGGEFIRHRLASRIAAASIGFWKSKWGARVATLAGVGLKPVERPALGMPVLTEVALGRATDHLFQALPKATRRELAALPETVRRLE